MPDNEKPSKIPSPSDLFKTNVNTPSPDELFSSKQTDIISEGFEPIGYDDIGNADKIESTLDFIQKTSKRVMRDDEKDILRDMINNPNLKHGELSDAIVTLQGKKAKQQDNTITTPDYYMDNVDGVYKPVALAYGEKAPSGKDVAKIWGTQKSANDDNWFTDLAKTAYNIIPSSVENVIDLAQAATTLVTGEESTTLQAAKNSTEALKMAKDEDLGASIYNTEGVQGWGDLISKDRLNFTPEAIWGTVNGALGSVGEMLTLGGAASKALGMGAKAATFTGSYLTNLGEAMDSAESAGLEGRDKSAFALAITVPLAAIDAKFDIGGKILSNQIANRAKNDIIQGVGQRIVRDELGNITEESLKQASKEAIAAYTPLVSNFTKIAAKDVLQEGGEEALQSFVSTAGEQLWDKLTPEDRQKFGTDAFSAQSFAKYISEGVAGLVGGAPLSVSSAKGKQKAEHQEQSNSAYEAAKDGPEAVKALKTNLNNSYERGEMSKPDLESALFKVDAYNEYENTTKDLSLDDNNRKTLFELSLQKENLKASIKEVEARDTKGHSRLDELNPAQLGLHNAKVKQAKALQEEIDLIVAKSEIIQQPVVSEKIVEKVIKEEEKAAETPKPKEAGEPKSDFAELMGRYNIKVPEKGKGVELPTEGVEQEKPVTVTPTTKVRAKLTEVPAEKFNSTELTDMDRKTIVQEHLKSTPNMAMEGFIEEGQNKKLHINLGDNKYVALASSVEPEAGKNEVIRRENLPSTKEVGKIKDTQGQPLISYKEPVVVQRQEILAYDEAGKPVVKDGKQVKKAVLNVFNKDTGKYIVSVREKGKIGYKKWEASKYSQKEVEQLKALYEAGYNPKEEVSAPLISKVSKTETVAATEEKPTEKPVEQEKRDKVVIEVPAKQGEVSIGEGTQQVTQKPKDTSREIMTEVYKGTPKTYEDAVLAYFAGGGKMSIKSYVEGTGFGEKFDNGRLKDKGRDEYNANKWALIEDAESLTDLAKKIWEENANLEEESYVESEAIETIKDVLNSYPSQQDMVGELTSRYKKEAKLETGYATEEQMRYAEEQEAKEKEVRERELTEAEKQELITEEHYRKESDEYQADKYENLQKKSSKKGDFNKVVEAIKKAFPKVEVIIDNEEFNNSYVAGKLGKDGKIYINPNYAGLDTPIHEAGHILIDLMGDNQVIKVAIEQLKTTSLWAETKVRYPELTEGQLGKEVLAEAIGIEGADIFDTQVEKNRFSKYLDYIFDWFKTKLGLNKNIAKSLAKQIIGGIGTKEVESVTSAEDQLQKPKKAQVMGFSLWRETYKLRNIAQEQKDLDYIEKALASPSITQEQVDVLNTVKDKIKKIRRIDSTEYAIYKSDLAQINEIKNSTDLDTFSLEELTKALNSIESLDVNAKASFGNDVKLRIGYYLHRKGQERISATHKDYIESVADKKDISKISIKMMVLSHADQNQPAMQELSKNFDNSYLDMVLEINDKQSENTQLARAVIKEKNSKMGVSERALNLFSSDNSIYFEYMDNGKGELLTKEEAAKKNLSKAQTAYLNFTRDLITERSKQMVGGEYVGENMDMEVIKVDKSFMEAFKSEGLVEAFSYYLGGGRNNLRNVRIEYKNPITGVTKNESFGIIEQRLAQLGKKGTLEKGKALAMLLHYNFKAKRQLKTGQNVDEKQFPLDVKGDSEYSLNGKGQLVSKFDKNRGEGRGYSKDFFRAANEFISETAHTKHLSPIVAIAQSVQHLAKNGYIQEGILEKPKVAEYLEEWMNMHLFKQANVNDPLLDATLRKLRGLTSMSTMLFNITAQGINAFMGNYNNYRSENAKTIVLGNKRLFGGKHEITKRGGYGVFNPYAMDIIKKYNIANVDTESNPRLEVGTIFEKIGSLGTRWGEIQIQSSLALGLMSEEDYNSFEYVTNANGVKKLEVKAGVDKQALKERIINHTNRVSDIQGKYGEKDRRNILNGEFGKAVFQFKVWIPDWWKERYGAEYIDRNNVVRKGSWNIVTSKGRKDLLKLIDKKGWKKGLFDGKTPESKAFLSSLKGVMVTGMFLVLKYSDDEDDRKRKQAMLADKMIGNMLFVFDPNSLSYTISTPAASLGTAKKMVDAVGKLMKLDAKEAKSAGKDVISVLPGKKLYKYLDEATD